MRRLPVLLGTLAILIVVSTSGYVKAQVSGITTLPRNAISPAIVTISNFYPGAVAEQPELPPITLHRGVVDPSKPHETEGPPANFSVSYEAAAHIKRGFVRAPSDISKWIVIYDPTPSTTLPKKGSHSLVVELAPMETVELPVKIEMPLDAQVNDYLVAVIKPEAMPLAFFIDFPMGSFPKDLRMKYSLIAALVWGDVDDAKALTVSDAAKKTLMSTGEARVHLDELYRQGLIYWSGVEFWIIAKDESQTGKVQAAIGSRWQIFMGT